MPTPPPHIRFPQSTSSEARVPSGPGLPGECYWSEPQFAADLERVFYQSWLFVAHISQIPTPGDYLTFTIGRDPIIVVRENAENVRAFFNVCRHRGSLICDRPSGHATKFVCPYHQWVYGLDGRLEHCRLMNDDIDKDEHPLHSIHVEVEQGFIFICLSARPRSFAPAREAFSRFMAPHGPETVKVCCEIDYRVQANWKTIFENNRECYHCATGHHEFCLSNFDYGMPGDPRSSGEFIAENDRMTRRWQDLHLEPGPINFPNGQWFRCMRFPLKAGFVTESIDGEPVAPVIGDFANHDIGSLRIVGLPNMWFHLNSDYFMTTRLIPASPTETLVKVVWYVDRDAREGVDYDPQRVAEVWRITSEQDWKLCEMNQLGMQSTRYAVGPLCEIAEQGVTQFAQWYLAQLAFGRADERFEEDSAKAVLDCVDDLLRIPLTGRL